jgi:Mg-chelatase subunit ChlD
MADSGLWRGNDGFAKLPKSALFTKEFRLEFGAPETGITACGRLIGTNAMRGTRCAGLRLLLLAAALLGAGDVAAKDEPLQTAAPALSTTIVVLDASKSMNAKLGGASKITSVRSELGNAVGTYGDRLAFGLVAFGHRKTSNCADSELLAKPGELTAATQGKLLGGLKPRGQAPIAAALSDAAKAAPAQATRFDIVLIADSADTCNADVCATAATLKQKSPALRIHVIGLSDKKDELKALACIASATGGTFVTAANTNELKQGVATVFDAVATPPAPPSAPAPSAQAVTVGEETTSANAVSGETVAPRQSAMGKQAPQVPSAHAAPGETAIQKSPPPAGQTASSGSGPQVKLVQSLPIGPPTLTPQVQLPVPVTFKALVTEVGPKLQAGLTWRVYASKTSPDGAYKLVSTHHEANPTAALLPGEYLVNAAYGLSNLTKKIKVESGRSLEETFVLNTGGLKLAAVLPNGEPLPDGSVRFDILSDEEDQFGNRHSILGNAKPGAVIRLNAGAYHIESLYGDANAKVKCDVTVEPGKLTEATIKQTGAKTTFKLVQTLGGEALADTKWKILTSAGDVVKENAGALPTHILAAGSYAVIAEHGDLSYTRKFSIEGVEAKQIEVVIDDGPTSPEDLKALTDPPEPPPPPSGTPVAGDEAPSSGGPTLGFDGFSATPHADPNMPLINPGALLRPAR